MPPLQRRYSVTGQTPPDNSVPKQQHSPKLQALDTSVQSTPSCGLCDPGPDAAAANHEEGLDHAIVASDRGRTISNQTTTRVASKRSATQLPSPNTPTSHELPPKIARLGLESPDMDEDLYEDVEVDAEADVDADVDEGVFTDMHIDTDMDTDTDQPWTLQKTAPSATPFHLTTLSAPSSFDSDSQYDSGVESLALTPPASTPEPTSHIPTTFLTLPPELRHQIYLHLPDLVLPYPLIYCLSTFTNNVQHPLASVNRLIRQEALAIFYSYNTWTIKLEFKLMYEAFQDWIIRLGNGASLLRLVTIAVRGKLFKPRTSHANANLHATNVAHGNANAVTNGMPNPITHVPHVPGMPVFALAIEQYSPPDGDAMFSIDLSEKFPGGKVALVRNEGTGEAGEAAVGWLRKKVRVLWEKRRTGKLNGQDWVDLVDGFLRFAGWS